MKKKPGIVLLLFITAICLYACRDIDRNREIDANKVYVIGWFRKGENTNNEKGWRFVYEYKYGSRFYQHEFYHPVKGQMISADTIFLEISKKHPGLAREFLSVKPPSCLGKKEIPDSGWVRIPECWDE